MSWLNAISTANRETRNVEAANRQREQDIRNLQRMRQQDMDAATERDRQARGKADAQQDIPGFVDLPSGGMWGMNTPAAPQAPQSAPAPGTRPVNPAAADKYRAANGTKSPADAQPWDFVGHVNNVPQGQAGRRIPERPVRPPPAPAAKPQSATQRGAARLANKVRMGVQSGAPSESDTLRMASLFKRAPIAGGNQSTAETERELRRPVPTAPQGGGLTPEFFAAQRRVESGNNPNAVSPKGALGTMQTMPNTLVDPGYGVRPAADRSPAEMQRVGEDYMGAMLREFGRPDHALVAYNWGPGNAQKWIAAGADASRLPAETRQYVAKLLPALQGALPPAAAPGLPVQQPTQVAQGAQPIPTDAAAVAPQAQQVAQSAQQVDRGTVAGLSPEDDQALRVLRLQHSELARRLPYAKDIAEAQAIRDKLVTIVSGAQDIQVRSAATQAIDDDQALTSLARAAGTPFTQTPDGFVLVKPDGQGNWRAASPPADRMALITHITGVLTGSLAARAAEDRKAGYKVQESVATEQVKGLNKLREIAAKGQMDMQSELMKYQLSENDVKGVDFNPTSGAAIVRTTRGVFEVVPGGVGDLAGPSTLRPIQ